MRFSPQAILQYLQQKDSKLFKSLWPGTISHWIEDGKWTSATIENADRGKAIVQSRRSGVLKPYPEIVDIIKAQLYRIWTIGLQVNTLVARAVMLAVITKQIPHIMAPTSEQGNLFFCSEYFV